MVTVAVSPASKSLSEIVKLLTDGGTVYVQLNCEAAVLPLPAASVNAPAFSSIVVAPPELGVNVAV